MNRTIARVVLVACCAVLAGCSRGDDDRAVPTPGPTEPARTVRPGQHGPTVKGDYAFTGALKLDGEYTVLYSFGDERSDTCGEIAGTEASGYVIPLPTFNDERRFVWTAGIRQYDGPGSYDIADLEVFTLELRDSPDGKPVEYVAAEGARADLEVEDDNSGSFAFSGLKDDEANEISGTAEWSCAEGSEGTG